MQSRLCLLRFTHPRRALGHRGNAAPLPPLGHFFASFFS
jgi:hypothetical protein